jgi:hypothetical protein
MPLHNPNEIPKNISNCVGSDSYVFEERFLDCPQIQLFHHQWISSTPLLNFGSYSETCVPCFACCPKANFNNLKVSIAFLPIQAEFDVDTVRSFLLLSGYDKTASGAAHTLTSQHITQQSYKLQPYSKLAVTEHTLLYLLVRVNSSSTVSQGIT